ncbi:MAG: GTPase HflX, partial [Treponema sp.]|nr:GTPase HflX [Treponema sp.]
LPLGTQILLVDTVGFIRNLPHNLVDAFRSTLEEASGADLLLNILDASDSDITLQYETTLSVIRDLGAENIPMIKVLNKIDKLDSGSLEELRGKFPDAVPVSALPESGQGLATLCERIEHSVSGANMRFRFPLDRTDLAALVHRSGPVISEKYGDNYIEMEALVDERTAGRLREYQYEGKSET